jgi:hypothetical protein
LTQTENRKPNEDKTFDKNGGESDLVRDQTGTVESNNSVGEVRVQPHTRRASNGHVGEETHSKGRQSRDGSSGSDQITPDFLNTLHVIGVGNAEVLHAFRRAHASATSFRDDSAVDRDDVGHGEESSQTSADFSEEVRALSLLRLRGYQPC